MPNEKRYEDQLSDADKLDCRAPDARQMVRHLRNQLRACFNISPEMVRDLDNLGDKIYRDVWDRVRNGRPRGF